MKAVKPLHSLDAAPPQTHSIPHQSGAASSLGAAARGLAVIGVSCVRHLRQGDQAGAKHQKRDHQQDSKDRCFSHWASPVISCRDAGWSAGVRNGDYLGQTPLLSNGLMHLQPVAVGCQPGLQPLNSVGYFMMQFLWQLNRCLSHAALSESV
jgi:hypothetical protein